MARVTAPLLSFGGAGQIAKTQVYASWKGLPYVRRYTVPANPRSTDQTLTRNTFKWLNSVFQLSPEEFRAPWSAFVSGRPLTNRNAYVQRNLAILRSLTDLTGIVMSPGAKGGLPATAVLTDTATTITATITEPSVLPPGWSIVGSTAVAIAMQNPQSNTDYEIFVGTDAATPFAPVISGLTTATEYMVGSWLIYQRSSLATDLAYGPSVGVSKTTA